RTPVSRPRSSGRTSDIWSSCSSVSSCPRTRGRPYPEGPAIRSIGSHARSRATSLPGSSRSAPGIRRAWSATTPSASRSRSRLRVPGSVPTTRATGSPQGPGDGEDFLGVEELVVGREEFLNRFLVDLHLGAADPERPPGADAAAIDPLVGRGDAFDPQGG